MIIADVADFVENYQAKGTCPKIPYLSAGYLPI